MSVRQKITYIVLEVEHDSEIPDRVEVQLAAETACGEISSHLSELNRFGIGPAVRVVQILESMHDRK